MKTKLLFVLLLSMALVGCKRVHRNDPVVVRSSRLVSIEVEVYDPITNFVWEGVSVRIVEADNEWSGCICPSPYLDWFDTGMIPGSVMGMALSSS